MATETGTLYQDGKELCIVTVVSHTPATRPVEYQPTIGGGQIPKPQRVIPGSITFTCRELLQPGEHSYSFAQGGLPPARLDIVRIPPPTDGLYTVHADLGFPGV